MSYKYYNKTTCERGNKISSAKTSKYSSKAGTPKKVLLSKKIGPCSTGKSCSDGIITEECSNKPKKFTKSDVTFLAKSAKKPIDYCRRCGDHAHSSSQSSNSDKSQSMKKSSNNTKVPSIGKVVTKTRSSNPKLHTNNGKSNGVKQYYKNENFKSTVSLQDTEAEFRKISLDTIKEVPEAHTISETGVNIYNVLSDSEEQIGFLDTNDVENIEQLKKFREDNYFECHSVKSRIDTKGSVTSLVDHKCVYRFYLNDRLFPVPISTDHHDNVRCVECHLPINLKMDDDDDDSNETNGTLQAKVKLSDDEAQDLVLFLPVKDSLIIKERRKQIKTEEEVLYFGVIKLSTFGNSVFNSNLPNDSLALKYQKGYQEYGKNGDFKYKDVEKDDVIII